MMVTTVPNNYWVSASNRKHNTIKNYKPSQKPANNQLFLPAHQIMMLGVLDRVGCNPKRIIFDKLGTGLENQLSQLFSRLDYCSFVFTGHSDGTGQVCSLLSGSKLNTEENSVFIFILLPANLRSVPSLKLSKPVINFLSFFPLTF